MPQYKGIVNIPGMEVIDIKGINPLNIYVRFKRRVKCVRCKSGRLHKKKRIERQIRHESMGKRHTILHISTFQFRCMDCNRYFHQRIPGIQKWQRATEAFRHDVYERHRSGIAQSLLAKQLKLGSATIERWTHYFLKRKDREARDGTCPKYLGIDEHSFSRKKGFATTFCDLKNNRIMDIALGRSDKALSPYLHALKGKENVDDDLYRFIRNIPSYCEASFSEREDYGGSVSCHETHQPSLYKDI